MDHEHAEIAAHVTGRLTIDLTTEIVTHHNQEVALTATEWHLLRCFVQHHNCILTSYQIMEELRTDMSDAVLRVFIRRLRKKLEPNPAHPQIIRTLHGRGYRFVMSNYVVVQSE